MTIFDLLMAATENSLICIFIHRIFREGERERSSSFIKFLLLFFFISLSFIFGTGKIIQLCIMAGLGIAATLFLYKTSLINAIVYNMVWLAAVVLSDTIAREVIMYIVRIRIGVTMAGTFLNMISVMLSLMIKFIILMFASNIVIRRNLMLRYGRQELIILGIWTISWITILIGAMEVAYIEAMQNSLWIVIMLVSVIIFYVIIFFVFEKYVEDKNFEKNEILVESSRESLALYYSELEKENRKVRALYHDMKNHLLMYDEIRRENSYLGEEYRENLLEQLNSVENYYHTGNVVLDILLKKKAEQAGQIRMDIVVQKESIQGFEAADLCALFSNALDNAIEHQKGRESQGWIRLRSTMLDDGEKFIVFENPLYDQLHIRNGKIITKKSQKENHGIGLMSIQDVVKRYHGTVTISTENNTFCLMIRFNNMKN